MKKLIGINRDADAHWVGNGFPVRTIFSYQTLGQCISPFLLLDYAGPAEFPPSDQPRGVGEHPHRGFETVTIVYQGELEHRDSAGNHGRIGPGDVQWMTAASGVVHEEWHEQAFTRRGGVLEMVQLWVNLPRRDKRIPARYQDTPSERIPIVSSNDGKVNVKVIAGEALGATAVIETRTPIVYLHVRLQPGGALTQAVDASHNVFAYVLEGAGLFGSNVKPAREGQMALYAVDGNTVEIFAKPDGSELSVLLIGGRPPRYELAVEVERVAAGLLGPKGIYPNVDFYSGIIYEALGIPTDLFTPIFAVARVAGWLAHWLEQLKNNRIYRPEQIYVGKHDVAYVPLEKRP